jgi:hypothetical protein
MVISVELYFTIVDIKLSLSLFQFTYKVIVKSTSTEVSPLDVVGVRNLYEIFVVIICGLLLNLLSDYTPAF